MPMVVAFVSQKGGVGKSTLARALASVVAHGGLSVLLADLDMQQATTKLWAERRDDRDLTVASFDTIDDAVDAAEDVAILIVDTPGRAGRSTLAVAQAAHLIVVPTGPSVDDLHPTVLLHHELVGAGIPAQRIACAICRTLTKDEERDARSYLEAAACTVLPGALPERAAYRSAQNSGAAVTETGNKELDATADKLIEALLNRIAEQFEKTKTKSKTTKKGKAS